MENRLLLAFVLSLGVFVGWGYFLAQVQGPLPTEEQDVKTRETRSLPSQNTGSTNSVASQSQPLPPVTPTPINQFPGKEVLIQVSAGKAHFIISNRGGILKQLQLPRFKNDSGETIDLIDNPDNLTGALALKTNDPEVTKILQNAHYEPSTTSIVLDENNLEERLTLILNHSSGLQVTRTYTFHFNDYLVEMSTQVNAASMSSRNLQYQILLGPGMGGKISSQTD